MTTPITFTRDDAERLVRVEVGLNAQSSTLDEIKDLLEKQNGRVRSLEKKQNWMLGVGSAMAFGLTTAACYFGFSK